MVSISSRVAPPDADCASTRLPRRAAQASVHSASAVRDLMSVC